MVYDYVEPAWERNGVMGKNRERGWDVGALLFHVQYEPLHMRESKLFKQ